MSSQVVGRERSPDGRLVVEWRSEGGVYNVTYRSPTILVAATGAPLFDLPMQDFEGQLTWLNGTRLMLALQDCTTRTDIKLEIDWGEETFRQLFREEPGRDEPGETKPLTELRATVGAYLDWYNRPMSFPPAPSASPSLPVRARPLLRRLEILAWLAAGLVALYLWLCRLA